ncbi:MAG: hypothetical protein ACTTJC_05210 [Campylobacter sp.]
MSKRNLLNLILIAVFSSGCASFWGTKTPKYQPAKAQISKPKPLPNGFVKGVIQSVSYQNGVYCYDIKSVDTSNNKLQSGVYCADKLYAQSGDLIYASVRNGKIFSILTINQSKNSKFAPKKPKTNIVKTDKKRDISKKSNINVPQSQNISFD